MGELRKYKVRQGGMETVLNLSDEDVKALYPDAVPVEDGDEGTATKARPTTGNKARTTENK